MEERKREEHYRGKGRINGLELNEENKQIN